jgi:hypothetical protein
MKLSLVVCYDESLARYLTHSDHYNLSTNSVKPRAFEPRTKDLCLSVFRVYGLNTEEILQIGQDEVINKSSQLNTLYGYADIKAKSFIDLSLNIKPDNDPPRHASVLGWPEEKSKRKSIAQQLAASAKLISSP